MANKETHSKENLSMENTFSKVEMFLGKNQKLLIYVGVVIVLLVGGYFGVKYLYIQPKQEEAAVEMFAAERYFEADSLQIALNGNGQNLGFLDIIENYSITSSANLAHYYAGISYLHLGQYEQAIQYLKKFKANNDPILFSISRQGIADAYSELGQNEEALKFYLEAAKKYANAQTAPMPLLRAALICEKNAKYSDAIKYYTELRENYPQSQEAAECDKYIARTKARMQ